MATLATYVQTIWYRISQGKPEADIGIYRAAIEQSIGDALSRFGQQVAESDPATRARLQKSFSLTLSSGEIAVSATIVSSSLPAAQLTLSGTTEPLQYQPQYQDLIAGTGWAQDYVYFTIHEGKIKVRDYAGAVPSATGLTVYCSYVPTISEVPAELENDLYDIGCALVLESMQPQEVAQQAATVN